MKTLGVVVFVKVFISYFAITAAGKQNTLTIKPASPDLSMLN